MLSHDPGATASHQVPPTIWFLSMQLQASSSTSSDFYPINSGPLQIINQSASLHALFSTPAVSTGTTVGLHQFLIFTPPQNKAGKKSTPPPPFQPATEQLHICNICIMWQFLSTIRPPSPSVWLPCVISILSKPPK